MQGRGKSSPATLFAFVPELEGYPGMRPMITIGLSLAGLSLTGCGGLPAAPTRRQAFEARAGRGWPFPCLMEKACGDRQRGPRPKTDAPTARRPSSSISSDWTQKETATTVPTDVTFVMDLGRGSTRTVSLKADPSPATPRGGPDSSRRSGPYRVEDFAAT